MVAGRDHGDARAEEVDRDFRGDSAAMRGVFAIHHHEINSVVGEHGGDDFFGSRASRFANNVTQKKKSDHRSFL